MYNQWPCSINKIPNEIVERVDSGSRTFIKANPLANHPVVTANILDDSNSVKWPKKESHFETVLPNGSKIDYSGAQFTGSVYALHCSGTLVQSQSGTIVLYPAPNNSYAPASVLDYVYSGNAVLFKTNSPSYVCYASSVPVQIFV